MMDRLEFLNKLRVEEQDFATMVINSFDQFMALYSIVGQYEKVGIVNEQNLNFTIILETEERANQLVQMIMQNCNMITAYGRVFNIIINAVNSNQINITIY